MQEAAGRRNVEVSVHRVTKGGEIAAAMDTAQVSGATALNVLASPMLYISRRLIMDRVAAPRMPAMYQWPEMAEEGGFAAYGSRLTQLPELVARQLVKVLRGAKAADIPVEQPTKFELVINLKTAQALGLTRHKRSISTNRIPACLLADALSAVLPAPICLLEQI